MRQSDAFVISAWAGTVFGVAEGAVLCFTRAFPAILAPYKTSAHVLWVAPVVDLCVFTLIAVALRVLQRLAAKWVVILKSLSLLYALFLFVGTLTVITAPKLIHLVSALLLSAGLTVVCLRALRGNERQVLRWLRDRVWWLPGFLMALALGVLGYDAAREVWLYGHLPSPPRTATNVLVVVMDTVRYDSFTRPAGQRLTPNLDLIAARGLWFEDVWATSSWSLPSQASILTGQYPHEHGADWPDLRLDDTHPTLAEFLSERGYVTGLFSGNSAWVTPEYLGRGFLRSRVYILEDLLRRTANGRKIDRLLWEVGYHYSGRGKKAPKVNEEFLAFLDDYAHRPFFAYICYMDVNQAFHDRWLNAGILQGPPPMQEVFEAYEQGLRALDQDIGDLFRELERRGVLKDTLVIVTSDHGQSFGPAVNDHDPVGHGTSLYPEQVRVPLLVVQAGRVPAGRRVASTSSLHQVPATVVQLLGLRDAPFPGRSLAFGEPESASPDVSSFVLATLNYGDRRIQSVMSGQWLYINDISQPDRREELYDLVADPLATQNLAPAHPSLQRTVDVLEQLLTWGAGRSPLSQGVQDRIADAGSEK